MIDTGIWRESFISKNIEKTTFFNNSDLIEI